MKKIVLADVGNTSIKLATGGVEVTPLHTVPLNTWMQNPSIPDCEMLLVSSVVPEASERIRNYANHCKVLFAGTDIEIPLKNRTKLPKQVGVDRLLSSFAAFTEAKSDVIVLSCGTAFAFNIVQNGGFWGGNIIPGPFLMAKSLSLDTALVQLDEFNFSSPDLPVLGTTTQESVEKGISHAILATTESLVAEYRFILGNPKIFAFGGWSKWLVDSVNLRIVLREDLVLQGLNLLAVDK